MTTRRAKRSNGVYFLFIVTLLALVSGARAASISSESANQHTGKNWPTVGGDLYNSRYSTQTRINRRNVRSLGAAWVSRAFEDGSRSSVTPLIANGVMFVTAGRRVYALNAKTGEEIWSYTTVPDPVSLASGEAAARLPTPRAVPNSKGVAIGNGMVFVGLVDGHVIALKEQTGQLIWMQQTGATVPKRLQRVSGAPVYVNGLVLTGLANGDANLRGRLTALDADTGKELWQLFTVPGPGEPGHETWPSFNDTWRVGGGGVWTNAAVDPELGLAYFTTGNPVPAFAGDLRPGNNLYTCSVLAIDIRTGQLKWHYQLVRHDVFEADIATPVLLHDFSVKGRSHKAVSVMRPDGHIFHLNRETGAPILSIEERPVPQSISQRTASTQPFPVGGESILMSCEDWRTEKIPMGFVLGCMWTPPASPPPSKDPQNILAPFPSARISPMAYSPLTRYIYAQAPSTLVWPRRSQDPYQLTFDTTVFNLISYRHLTAIDSRTGKVVWKTRINIKSQSFIDMTGGLLATAGGLVFRSSSDGNVEGYDAETGQILWAFQTGELDARGSPVTYEIDGEQFIAVPMGTRVWSFKLGGKIPAEKTLPPILQEDEFSAPIVDTNIVETISLKTSSFASVNRYFIDEFSFSPTRARISAGTTLMFANNGRMSHEIVAADGSWGTGPLSPAEEAWVNFSDPGKHAYFCKMHPWTHGQIIVTDQRLQQEDDPWNGEKSLHSKDSFAVQAANGKQLFSQYCVTCHLDVGGIHPMAPSLFGSDFAARWRENSVGTLLGKIQTTMPPESPGSLPKRSYLSIIAYLLRENIPATRTRELTDSPEALDLAIGDSSK